MTTEPYDVHPRHGRSEDFSARLRKVGRWLVARPLESWLFFVGGILAGRILL